MRAADSLQLFAGAAALADFFSGRFHQDWSLDDASWEAVVDSFCREQPSDVATVAGALRTMLVSVPEAKLEEVLFRDLGSYFVPTGVGAPTCVWLDAVASRLENAVAQR